MDTLIATAIATIVADRRAGAVTVAARAADVLLQRAQADTTLGADAFRQDILQIGWTLIQAHPLTAPLINLINRVLWKMEQAATPAAQRAAVVAATTEFQRQLRYHEGRVAVAALPLIGDGAVVLTHAHSSTVRAALLHSFRAGRRFVVLCAETRPLCEGREMAAELVEAGLAAELLPDPAALAALAKAQLVLIGAEHLTADGLTNRIGTSQLARAAMAASVPIYALCGSEKFLPPAYVPPGSSEHRHKLTPEQTDMFYDRIPLSLLSGVVTEEGVLVMPAIEAWLAALHLHHDLV